MQQPSQIILHDLSLQESARAQAFSTVYAEETYTNVDKRQCGTYRRRISPNVAS